jgi:hypothetical protein
MITRRQLLELLFVAPAAAVVAAELPVEASSPTPPPNLLLMPWYRSDPQPMGWYEPRPTAYVPAQYSVGFRVTRAMMDDDKFRRLLIKKIR